MATTALMSASTAAEPAATLRRAQLPAQQAQQRRPGKPDPQQEQRGAHQVGPEVDQQALARQRQHQRGQFDDQHDRERGARGAEVRQVERGLALRCLGLHALPRLGALMMLVRSNSSAFSRIGRGDVLVAVAARHELRVLRQHALHHRQRHAEARRHVVADPEVLGVQPHPETGRVGLAHHVGSAVHEVPAGAGALAERLDELVQRQALGVGERHGLGDRLDDARRT